MSSAEKPKPQYLAGKVAIVTGGSRGIGAGIAIELAQRGAKVAITYSQPKSDAKAQEVVNQIKALGNSSTAIAIRKDLSDVSAPKFIVAETIRQFGSDIDILVNNAGVERMGSVIDTAAEDFDFVYNVNVRAPLLMLKEVIPYLRSPGRIINIGSIGGRQGFPGMSVYCSSKTAIEGMTRCWAWELGGAKHTVNAVNPGPVPSDMLQSLPLEVIEKQKANTPVENRVGSLDDIAQIVAWLASEESRWVTGQVIAASGGCAMY
ncbi:uncharacterized protein BHQ10_006381 [Talaromyces amestolkiae]|uniref:Ketoreductase domain-containing protein n=1 Tax=Talaromyces amestolkiae TaxID=1196081 RepID=A0A364L3H9_TALAM|nr:uncharacterized protein BHQ10_006381 [Talaromyces amestolkiae]RAO70369.1 hypothetical protein BHQ10_006381 [Talaromyces amestolkiae]